MRRLLLLALLALSLCACDSYRDRAVQSMNGVAVFADGAHDQIADRYERDLQRCAVASDTKAAALACGADVDEAFAPRWTAYRAMRASWLALAGALNAADLLGEDISEVTLLRLMRDLGEAVAAFKDVIGGGAP